MVMMVASQMVRPLDFAAFPAVLLVTTLLRLSLNVASTRVVLLEGHTGPGAAGKVIESFGHFLVGGNFAVGLIVFAVLVVINFIVVTKGAERIADVGVAGLQRLLNQLTHLESHRVLIVCAGMEGSLPTVVAGLVPQPVIAVPVSVGYGVSAGGRAAMEGMLSSCAPGLTVVNIDNGYGAAMAALRILGCGPERSAAWTQGS
jgi:hypothetical protein